MICKENLTALPPPAARLEARIEAYLEQIESAAHRFCKEQLALAAFIRKCFATEDIYTDSAQLDKYLGLAKYFPFDRLFPWEEFLIALWNCTYWKETGRPRWKTLFCMVGRGAGKDGLIAFISASSLSPYNPVPRYDVDICANNEDQAKRPVTDLSLIHI